MKFSLTDDRERKRFMYNIMTFACIGALLLFGTISLLNGTRILAISDYSFAVILSALLLWVRKKGASEGIINFSLILVQSFFLYLFLSGKAGGVSFVWFFIVPVVTQFLKGGGKGLFFSLAQIALAMLPFLFPSRFPQAYAPRLGLRLLVSYLVLTSLVYIYETSRDGSQVLLEKALGELQEKANRDGLTGLYNRRHLNEIWAFLKRDYEPPDKNIAFIMADLDFFRSYNDTYGHQKGDEALITFGEILKGLKRRKTDYVFRYGGEEFCLFLYGADEKTSKDFCRAILDGLQEKKITHEKSPTGRLSVSLGCTIKSLDTEVDLEGIIKEADDALYRAKEKGRNRVEFV